MSTEITTDMTDHTMVTFWGGDERGVMVQVTADRGPEGYVTLTFTEAAALANALRGFVMDEAKRRQELLKDAVAEARIQERTIFNEVMELSMATISPPLMAVELIDALCPRVKKQEAEQ